MKLGVTAMRDEETFMSAKVPEVAEPLIVTESSPNTPDAITAVPDKVALVLLS